MVLGLLEKMSPKRGMAQAYLEPAFKEGLSGAATLRMLQDKDIGYRKTDFYDDWRRIEGRPAREDVMKHVGKKYRPPGHLIESTPEYLSRQFRVDFTVRGRDPLTGEAIDTGYSLALDELKTIGELEEIMQEILEEKPEDYPLDIDELFVRGVLTKVPPL